MFRFAAAFALLGFAVAIVVALLGDAPLESVITSALLWAVTFGVLGFFLGRTAMALLAEAGIPETGVPEEASDDASATHAADSEKVTESGSGDGTEEPIEDDEPPQSSADGDSEKAATEA